MNDWYEIVPADKPLTQGDFIFNCPVPMWKREGTEVSDENEREALKASLDFISADVIVMTQACDLEHSKVHDVTLCPHLPLSTFKEYWETEMRASGQSIKKDTWKKYCDKINNGYFWNLTLLNNFDSQELRIEHRVVDFYDVYTVPKTFLESLLKNRGASRPRLLPPYREHLSQSFARFYMRVGLPTPINKAW
jgi:hypothetical protein